MLHSLAKRIKVLLWSFKGLTAMFVKYRYESKLRLVEKQRAIVVKGRTVERCILQMSLLFPALDSSVTLIVFF